MRSAVKLAGLLALLGSVAGAGNLVAQGTAPNTPTVTVGGVVYAQYLYQLKDTANHNNNFDITRSYINVIGKFPSGLLGRVTADIYRNADNSLAYRLKYAYAAFTPENSPLTFKFGEIHTPLLDWEEALWDYRMQGQMAMERGGYVSAADFGVGVDGKWGPDKVNFQVSVVNGEFYRNPEGSRDKDFQARLSVRVLDTDDSSRVGGLRVTGYAAYGKASTGAQRNRYLGMVSYRSKLFTLAGEGAVTQDGLFGATNGHVYSAFGVYRMPRSKAAVLA